MCILQKISFKKNNQQFHYDSGITLVALIITIIILIILAAVSIKAVLDMNFIDLASNAAINYAEAQGYEQNQLNNIDSFLQSTIKKVENEPSINPTPTPEETPTPTPPLEETMPIIPPASDKAGIAVNYIPKEGTYKKELVNNYSGTTYCNYDFTTDFNTDWLVWSLTDDAIYLICKGSPLKGGAKLESYQYTYSWENGIVRLTGYRRI